KSRPEPPEGHENFLPENEHETHAKTSCAECKFQKGNITALGDALALLIRPTGFDFIAYLAILEPEYLPSHEYPSAFGIQPRKTVS
ncbi:MAG: hypothetical protein SF053_03710, partial [Bacteroidia bacterium]|nr:hypothetical protein [Bacteroidia bacterium]